MPDRKPAINPTRNRHGIQPPRVIRPASSGARGGRAMSGDPHTALGTRLRQSQRFGSCERHGDGHVRLGGAPRPCLSGDTRPISNSGFTRVPSFSAASSAARLAFLSLIASSLAKVLGRAVEVCVILVHSTENAICPG